MAINPASRSALQGIYMSSEGLRRNAAEIASSSQLNGTASRSYAEPLVENIQYELQAGASVKVLQTEDRMLGALLDVRA